MPANFVNELNSLDFSKYIGGPMQAAVDAQNSAAMAQVNFIKEVGIKTETVGTGDEARTVESVNMIDFTFNRKNSQGANETVTLQVPLLTMLSIPSLRIDEMTIDFNCKLNSVETHDTSQSLGVDVNVGANAWKIKFNVSASYQYQSSDTEKVQRTYSMKVHVRVVNDEMPAGLERMLNILESVIETQITSSQNNNIEEPEDDEIGGGEG
jgi:hypothetical protein